MPPGTFIPELAYDRVGDAAAWLCRAFGFVERLRIADHRIQLCFGDGAMVVIERPAGGAATDADAWNRTMVRVEDVDAHYRQATQHGARILQAPTTHPFGERQYTAQDPGGHVWTFSQSVADSDPATWGGVLNPSVTP